MSPVAHRSAVLIVLAMSLRAANTFRTDVSHHAQGLEEEHELVEESRWPVTSSDRRILAEIQQILNPPGADVPWTWQDERQSWTFGLVALTAQNPKGALALHMLHRHGLGPLLASRAGGRFMAEFQSKLQLKGNPTGADKAKALVEAQEEYGDIQKLQELLSNLTLSGLRNLHSWDHAWSVRTGTGKVEGCTHHTPAACVLQAGHSPSAYSFLRQNGFSSDVSSAIQSAQYRIMIFIFNPLGYWKLGHSTRNALATTGNTGDITVKKWQREGSSNWFKSFIVGNKKVAVDVTWEGGAATTLNIPIDEDVNMRLKEASSQEAERIVADLVDNYIQDQLSAHKEYMLENRLTLWAAEEAEFVEMYPNLPK